MAPYLSLIWTQNDYKAGPINIPVHKGKWQLPLDREGTQRSGEAPRYNMGDHL